MFFLALALGLSVVPGDLMSMLPALPALPALPTATALVVLTASTKRTSGRYTADSDGAGHRGRLRPGPL
ncbi:hypothetical protein GR925_15045 [Streptomyces sp. HUCO-GS316]|uniref:hypothetical protein n=1 Tax=Streptomyces sp. HUCO-GS316 TaxID=2692198 RepID=UPI00136EA240|nr:hypothetical protein [Streptomyces sp. HUCO-GS316]MXM64726.1 hypothetical protein [Streptomyces sp. HUCO-GS316]